MLKSSQGVQLRKPQKGSNLTFERDCREAARVSPSTYVSLHQHLYLAIDKEHMPFHTIAILSCDRQKTITNRSESEVLSGIVIPFISNGVITAKWGSKVQSYQVLELRIYETKAYGTRRTVQKRAAPHFYVMH